MDLTAIVFYGVVCGALGAFAPSLGNRLARMAVGGGIGIGSALLLPFLRNMMGY